MVSVRIAIDILYELLLKSGFMPTEKIEKLTLTGKTVFSIAEHCRRGGFSSAWKTIDAEAEPMRFICLDKGFKGNDQLKANAAQTFAAPIRAGKKRNRPSPGRCEEVGREEIRFPTPTVYFIFLLFSWENRQNKLIIEILCDKKENK